MQLTAAFK